eukprot:jgi/Psemu1/300698/fgenesh1_kg.16_\
MKMNWHETTQHKTKEAREVNARNNRDTDTDDDEDPLWEKTDGMGFLRQTCHAQT